VHANEVVRVHDGVDETVQDDGEENITIKVYMCIQPVEKKDGCVMVDVQEGKLTPLLPENNKDGVPKIPNFGNVKEPEELSDRRLFKVPIVARPECVAVTIS
jgi:hypothetical protein